MSQKPSQGRVLGRRGCSIGLILHRGLDGENQEDTPEFEIGRLFKTLENAVTAKQWSQKPECIGSGNEKVEETRTDMSFNKHGRRKDISEPSFASYNRGRGRHLSVF